MIPDVVIAGGGVIGLSIARKLKKSGLRRITVMEKGVCGEEASWAAAGMLGPQAETDAPGPFLDLCLESRDLYPAFAAELLEETGIDIELDRTGTLYLSFSEADSRVLDERFAWQSAAGLAVERLSANEVRKAEPFVSPDVREALYFPGDWQVDNRKLLAALVQFAQYEIELLEHTPAERIIVEHGSSYGFGGMKSVVAGHTVLATGAWTSIVRLDDEPLPVKVEPVRGQILAFRTAKRLFGHVVVTPRGYVVPRADGRLLVGSTTEYAGFEKTLTPTAAARLKSVAFEIAPVLSSLAPVDAWSGLRPFARDAFPILGSIASVDDLTVATAHYRNGILLAPLTADMVADRIVNKRQHPAFTTFGPDRFALRASRARQL